MTVAEIKKIAEQYRWDYEIVAIRTQDVPFELGVIDHKSKVWDNGEETEDEINGISATAITEDDPWGALKMHSTEASERKSSRNGYYYGEYQAIICGNEYISGEDAGEVIIQDAVVVEIVK